MFFSAFASDGYQRSCGLRHSLCPGWGWLVHWMKQVTSAFPLLGHA
jgi:hypothetical protein